MFAFGSTTIKRFSLINDCFHLYLFRKWTVKKPLAVKVFLVLRLSHAWVKISLKHLKAPRFQSALITLIEDFPQLVRSQINDN